MHTNSNTYYPCFEVLKSYSPKILTSKKSVSTACSYQVFGVTLHGRDLSLTTTGNKPYRYGYQGSEMDNEVKDGGNSYSTYFRQLDPRLGRWMSLDPVFQPHQSPYCSMDNNPISNNDILGDKVEYETKRDKRRVFLARMLSKKFRAEHEKREVSSDTYTYRHRDKEPPLVAPRVRFDGTTPEIIDAGKMARLTETNNYSVLYDNIGIGLRFPVPIPPFPIPLPHINIEWYRKTKQVTEGSEILVPRQSDGSNPVQGPVVFSSPKRWVPGTPVTFDAQPHPDTFTFTDQNGNIVPFTDQVSGNAMNGPFTLVRGSIPLVGVINQRCIIAPGSSTQNLQSWKIIVTSQRYYTPVNTGDKFIPPTDNVTVFSITYTKYKFFRRISKINITWE